MRKSTTASIVTLLVKPIRGIFKKQPIKTALLLLFFILAAKGFGIHPVISITVLYLVTITVFFLLQEISEEDENDQQLLSK